MWKIYRIPAIGITTTLKEAASEFLSGLSKPLDFIHHRSYWLHFQTSNPRQIFCTTMQTLFGYCLRGQETELIRIRVKIS